MSTKPTADVFILPTYAELEDLIVEATVTRIHRWLDRARPGLCGRLDDLPEPLMARLAEQLHRELGEQHDARIIVRLLVNRSPSADWECQWTEAVRLRNPDESGKKRKPFLLLVPPGTELLGSLDVDTFQAVPCEDILRSIIASQIHSLPGDLMPAAELIRDRDLVRATKEVQRALYLFSIARNHYSHEAAGLSLCILGLWPHHNWLETGDQRNYWITKNRDVITRLKNGTTSLLSRIYSLDLTDNDQISHLYDLLSETADVGAAAERVATDQRWGDLDFSQWVFASLPSTVVITIEPLNLPKRADGYPVLMLREQPQLPLSWSVQPSPAQVPDLTHYLVELIASTTEAEDTVYASGAIPPGKSSRRSFKVKDLASLVRLGEFPEGLYRARVTAWAAATNITRQPGEGEDAVNVSDYFWIKDEGEEDAEATQLPKKDRFVSSYLEARREVQWERLKNSHDPWDIPDVPSLWDGPPDGKATQGVCLLQFPRQTFRIRLSNLLRRIEYTLLSRPESLGILQARLTYGAPPGEIPLIEGSSVPRLAANDHFLNARARLFDKIRGSDGQGTVETANLLSLRDEILAYAQEYTKLLKDAEQDASSNPDVWPERAGLAIIDTTRLTLLGLSEQTSVAILLAPTHPLRMLWSLQVALLGDAWLREAQLRGTAEALTPEMRQALQGGIQPINLPTVLFDRRRVGYLQAGQITPGWDIYLPAEIADKQSALARLSRALACSINRADDGTNIQEISGRVLRYLKQHPYVSQLQMNVFNPGDGKVVAELLSCLDDVYPDLRYDVRLFSHEKVRDDLGSALDYLVNPELIVGESAEKYSQAGKYRLYPNLSYSKNCVSDFLAQPRRFQAHLSLLLDVFHPRIEVSLPFSTQFGGSLFGLVQEETTMNSGGQGMYAWERQVIAKQGTEINDDSHEAGLIAQVLEAFEHFVAALGASPSKRNERIPTVRLDLSVDGQNLLYEIHRVSDWVLTLDRHLGIDYFDSPTTPDAPSPGILLDFSPEFLPTDQPVLMLTTRVDEEVDQIVTPALQRLNLDRPGCALRVIEWLRSLSGRLAMRLLSYPLSSQGVIGMALARSFLERTGMLQDTVIIPVDAHIQLLRKGTPDDASETRTDLILVRRVQATRQLEFTLIEVKCSAGLLTTSAYNGLRKEIEDQIARTQTALASLFDPMFQNPDRLDRPMRNQLLGQLLRFYAGRARRYGTLSEEAEDDFLDLISDLDSCYTVSFRQSGLVFELGREEDIEDRSGDVTIHRVGRFSCEQLLRDRDDTIPPPPSWDLIRSTIRGNTIWRRSSANDTAQEGIDEQVSSKQQSVGAAQADGNLDVNEASARREASEATENQDKDSELGQFPVPDCHYLVGATRVSPQWGILGKMGNDVVALDLNGCNTLSIFGVQGGGKSYTMGSILEMAIQPLQGINVLPYPLAAVVFHYNESQDYAPEFVTMAHANSVADEIKRLREEYAADPQAIHNIVVLTPADKLSARRQEFADLQVEPIAFHPSELTIQDWRFLMGAVGNDSMYIKELNLVMRSLRGNITIDGLRQGIDSSQMTEPQRKLARIRLRFAEQFLSEETRLRELLYPGRLIIVDFRDELTETDEALGLFVVMLRVFAGATYHGQPFNKWVAFDEAHKYIRNSSLVDNVVEVIRQMRHQATSVLIASQDPASLPLKIIELSSMVVLHRMDSPAWLKHIQRAITSLGDLTSSALSRLRPGEAYLWARSATDPLFTHRAVKIQCRPRVTQHGGATKEASGM